MKRIAIFTHGGVAPPPSPMIVPSIGGLVRRLSRAFEVTVYTTIKPDGYSTDFQFGEAAIRFVRSHSNASSASIAAQMIREFCHDHRRLPYDLTHGLWAFPGGLAAVIGGRIARIPSIVTLLGGETAGIPSIAYGNLLKRGSKHATLWICRNATALTVLTEFQESFLRLLRLRREVAVIPFGAEDRFYRQADPPPPPPIRILHIGSMNAVKDQKTLLLALRRAVPALDLQLTMLGDDTTGGALRSTARDLGIADRVTFEGYVSHDLVPRYLSGSHILLHSSQYEGQGVVFAEAAASGVPICGTRVGLLHDLGDRFAAIAEPGDDEGLARGIARVTLDAGYRSRLSAWARSWADTHTSEWTAERYAELYTATIAAQPLRAGKLTSSRTLMNVRQSQRSAQQ